MEVMFLNSVNFREFSSGLHDVLNSFRKLMETIIFYVKKQHNK